MWPWSGVSARSPPRMTAHSQHSHFFPLPRLWGGSQSLLLGGLIHLLLQDSCLTVLFLGSSRRLVTLRRIQSHVTSTAFLDHTHHCSSSPSSDHKSPLGPRAPWLCLGAHSPPAWSSPLTSSAGSPGALTTQGRLSALSWGGLCSNRYKKQ